MKKTVNIISHSHWDREWYMPFEYHRAKLIELMDTAMWLFETDPDFKCFFLDGQTIVLDDYLEIKPQNREKVKKYIKEGRFSVGPWYILQDEFLTSSEANVRNLIVGIKMANEFGALSHVGYFPDSFGNAGQMPQILKQAGMKAIAFGRGVKPTGMANEVMDSDDYASQFSEMFWQSPDGSKLPSILFANWYGNGLDVPADGNTGYWDEKIAAMEKYASTDELLLLNGLDHLPVQIDLSTGIKAARKNYPDYDFIHIDFETYADRVIPKMKDNVSVVKGELIGQNTNGWFNLVNTASIHQNLKLMNRDCEIALESTAEPILTIASKLGMEYPHDMLLYSWKTLMQNHPHDSICGCSCDEVNDEMRTRFAKSRQTAQVVIDKGIQTIASKLSKNGFEDCDAVFAVLNTYGREKRGIISVDVDIDRIYASKAPMSESLQAINKKTLTAEYCVVDENGRELPCKVENLRGRFGYDLPDQGFRLPYIAETVTVTFETDAVAGLGCKRYGLKKLGSKVNKESLVTGKNVMENEHLKVSVNADGTVDLFDKAAGIAYSNLLRYEDVGDCGTEYTFVPMKGDVPVLSGDKPAVIELISDEAFGAEYKITTTIEIPESGDEALEYETDNYFNIDVRNGGRSKNTIPMEICTYITLEKNANKLKVRTEFENKAKNHRLRVLVPTGCSAPAHKAGTIFDSVKRNNSFEAWTYPSNCNRQQEFMMMKNDEKGMCISNLGLYEYEILDDDTVAITLMRAVGELGDWGVFRTELSQCQTKLSLEYELIPGVDEKKAYNEACALQYPFCSVQLLESGEGVDFSNEISWSGDALRMSAFKQAQDGNDIIIRWVNYSDEAEILEIKRTDWVNNLYKSNVIEENLGGISAEDDGWKIEVKPHEIITLGVSHK